MGRQPVGRERGIVNRSCVCIYLSVLACGGLATCPRAHSREIPLLSASFEAMVLGDGIADDVDPNLLLSDYDDDGPGGGGANGYNEADLQMLLDAFGAHYGGQLQAVPEPSAIVLLLLGVLGLLPRLHRRKNL